MNIRFTILVTIALALVACGQKGPKNGNDQKSANGAATELSFPTISIPEMLPAEERAKFLAEHYWDKFDFSDTTFCNKPDITEQAYANYLDILRYVDPAVAQQSAAQLIKRAEVDSTMFDYFVMLSDKYLYDPNSPFRNDELLIPT